MLCTGNVCVGTKPAGTAQWSTLLRDKLASIALKNTLYGSTTSVLPNKSHFQLSTY